MLITKGISVQRYQGILNIGIGLFFSLTILIPLWALVGYVLFERNDLGSAYLSMSGRETPIKKVLGPSESLLDESIISLTNNEMCPIPFPDIASELVFLQHLIRPDCKKKNEVFLLGLEKSAQKRLVSIGEKVFLDVNKEKKLIFSELETPFWIDLICKKENEMEVDFHVCFSEENGGVIFEKNERLILQEKKDFVHSSGMEKGELGALTAFLGKVNICESDLLIEIYGGKSFDSVKNSFRMCGESLSTPLYIKPGDLFIWRDGKLEVGEGDTEGYPLLLVRGIDQHKCEMWLWDKEGVYGKLITLQMTRGVPSSLKLQDFFLKLHQRTEASVTCQLHGRNVVLRKRDWLLYSKGRFRNLRTSDEVKDYLRYALKGELFIFDGIVKKDGVSLLVGQLFNEERSQVRKVEIPLSEKKKMIPTKKREPKAAAVQVKDE